MAASRTSVIIGRVWVTFTSLLIGFIAFSVQIFVIWPWYGSELSIDILKLLGPFNALIGMLYWNYFMAVRTDPGGVPLNWRPEGDDIEVKKLTGGPRYCRSCERYKPPRAHHCRQCKRCVLRMDHHCPWVNNCVGHYNYAHFIRFLVYVDISCMYHLWMLTSRVFDAWKPNGGYWVSEFCVEPGATELVFIILNYVTCVPVILAVGAFSCYHIYCLLTNTTTIEGWEKDKVATLIRRGKIRQVKFPYDLGVKGNLYANLGPSALYWPLPMKTTSSGVKFTVAKGEGKWIDFHISPQESWPPQDPYHTSEHNGPAHDFSKDINPWTYGDGINPNLQPSNAYRRTQAPHSSLPPYHPDYNSNQPVRRRPSSTSSRSSSFSYEDVANSRIRRGSEGWEIQDVDREEVLQRYVSSRGAEVGRYRYYVPENAVESEDDDEGDGDGDGDDGVASYPMDRTDNVVSITT
ncbi:hypothetical protein M422DRAFT_154773 [Sphaerobolus stellatus SS14]|nr:hypothetical protein M422DRAFT_154773 [Sphaerobolus stellatus SS14]